MVLLFCWKQLNFPEKIFVEKITCASFESPQKPIDPENEEILQITPEKYKFIEKQLFYLKPLLIDAVV